MEKKYDGMDLWIALVLGTVIACLSWAVGVSIWAKTNLGTVAKIEQYAQEKKVEADRAYAKALGRAE